MKKIAIFIILALFSCKGQKEESNESQSERKQTQPAQAMDSVIVTEDQKTHLQTLLEDGLAIADASETCQSGQWEGIPQTKLVFNYPEGSKLILEEWEYSIEEQELRLLDFLIYNCNTGQILHQSQYTIASYEIIDVKPSLRIQINADLPSTEGELKRRPFIIKTWKEIDSTIVVENERLFNIENLSDQELKELIKKIESNNFNTQETDKIIIDLFRASVNNQGSAKDLFFKINDYILIDGVYSELYGDLKYLLTELEN